MSSLRLPDFGSVLSEKSGCPCERSAADCAWEGPLILEVAQQASHKCPQSDAIPSTKPRREVMNGSLSSVVLGSHTKGR